MSAPSQQGIQERAAQRDELLQASLDFISTLTGMKPPPIEVAPPEVFAPFYAFVDRVQGIVAPPAWQPLTSALVAEIEQAPTRQHWICYRAYDGPIVTVGTYEWRQGHNPHGFNTESIGRVGVCDITHVMPFDPPAPPVISIPGQGGSHG